MKRSIERGNDCSVRMKEDLSTTKTILLLLNHNCPCVGEGLEKKENWRPTSTSTSRNVCWRFSSSHKQRHIKQFRKPSIQHFTFLSFLLKAGWTNQHSKSGVCRVRSTILWSLPRIHTHTQILRHTPPSPRSPLPLTALSLFLSLSHTRKQANAQSRHWKQLE